jgi:hypothetical protein
VEHLMGFVGVEHLMGFVGVEHLTSPATRDF